MVNKDEDLSFITDEDGKTTPIQVVSEFVREEDQKRFVIYTDIEDPENDDEEVEYYVAEIVTLEDGSEEIREIDNEDDLAYCQSIFDDMVEEMMSREVSDDEENSEEDTIEA